MGQLTVRIIGRFPPPIGGVTVHTQRLYESLKLLGVDVRMSVLNGVDCEGEEQVHSLISWMLKRLFFSFEERIVHYQGASVWGLYFLVLVNIFHRKYKLLWSVHSEYLLGRLDGFFFRWVLKRHVHYVVCDNENIEAQAKCLGAKATKVISPFIMDPKFSSFNSSLLEDIPYDVSVLINAYKIVFNAQGEDVYGLDTLFSAMNYVQSDVGYVLLIPDLDDTGRQYLDMLTQSYGVKGKYLIISDRVNPGWAYINKSSVFVRPTITDGDALSVREALFLGVKTIVSDCTKRPCGTILFKNKQPKDLAKKIDGAVSSLSTRSSSHRMGSYIDESPKKFLKLYMSIGG